jgi:hypothetical protein
LLVKDSIGALDLDLVIASLRSKFWSGAASKYSTWIDFDVSGGFLHFCRFTPQYFELPESVRVDVVLRVLALADEEMAESAKGKADESAATSLDLSESLRKVTPWNRHMLRKAEKVYTDVSSDVLQAAKDSSAWGFQGLELVSGTDGHAALCRCTDCIKFAIQDADSDAECILPVIHELSHCMTESGFPCDGFGTYGHLAMGTSMFMDVPELMICNCCWQFDRSKLVVLSVPSHKLIEGSTIKYAFQFLAYQNDCQVWEFISLGTNKVSGRVIVVKPEYLVACAGAFAMAKADLRSGGLSKFMEWISEY